VTGCDVEPTEGSGEVAEKADDGTARRPVRASNPFANGENAKDIRCIKPASPDSPHQGLR
jgi:hypothetical protein